MPRAHRSETASEPSQPEHGHPSPGHTSPARPSFGHPSPGLLTVEDWQSHVLAAFSRSDSETRPLSQALGRTLAADVRTRHAVPLFDNSSMDGYAVRFADLRGATAARPIELKVVGDVMAGSAANPPIPEGGAVRVMTGAPVPFEADAIVPVEDTVEHQNASGWVTPTDPSPLVHVTAEPVPGRYIRREGEDAAEGTVVLAAGRVLTPRALAAVAAAGHDEVLVSRRPRVAVISTGSELAPAGVRPERGMIPDSNTVLLCGLVETQGGVVVERALVGDDAVALSNLLDSLDPHEVDVVVMTGGVSAGAFDVVKQVLTGVRSVTFARLAMQPGKPQAFGRLSSGIRVFGLPGNPVSAAVSFELFVRPALATMSGRIEVLRPVVDGTAAAGWASPPGRRQYMPVRVDMTARGLAVRPSAVGGSGSHLVASLADADGLAIVAAEATEVRPDDPVGVILFA